jgi:hypothetical protein
MTDEPVPETERECPACGGGPMKAECSVCAGTGHVTAKQAYHWRMFEQRRRAASSTFPLVEGLVRDILAKIALSERAGASSLVVEGVDLLNHWRETESLSHEREDAARELRVFHQKALDFLAGVND